MRQRLKYCSDPLARFLALLLAFTVLFGCYSVRIPALAEDEWEGSDEEAEGEELPPLMIIETEPSLDSIKIGDKLKVRVTAGDDADIQEMDTAVISVYWTNPVYESDDLVMTKTVNSSLPISVDFSEIMTAGEYSLYVYAKKTKAERDENGYKAYTQLGFEYKNFKVTGEEKVIPTLRAAAEKCRAGDEWQTALNVYKWLCTSIVYDKTLEKHGTDAILRKTGVCQSYAMLYALTTKLAGLDSYYVTGKTMNSDGAENHAWAAVRINGKYYYFDPTWEDCGNLDPAKPKEKETGSSILNGPPDFQYFAMDLEQCTRTGHIPPYKWYKRGEDGNPLAGEACDSLDANYYIHEGLWKTWVLTKEAEGTAVGTVPDEIRKALEAGKTYWTSRGYWVLDPGQSMKKFYMTDHVVRLLLYALNGYKLTLSDGTEVELEATSYESCSQVWKIINVYPKGKPDGDQNQGVLRLPQGLTDIEPYAFQGLQNIDEVICPEGLKTIGDYAFADGCVGRIYLPASLESIGDHAFENADVTILMETENSMLIKYAEDHQISWETKNDNG